jgi:hypothetical protein
MHIAVTRPTPLLCTPENNNQFQVVPPRTTSATHSVQTHALRYHIPIINYSSSLLWVAHCLAALAALRFLAPCRADKASTWPAPQVTHSDLSMPSQACAPQRKLFICAVEGSCKLQPFRPRKRCYRERVVHCHRKASGVPGNL